MFMNLNITDLEISKYNVLIAVEQCLPKTVKVSK